MHMLAPEVLTAWKNIIRSYGSRQVKTFFRLPPDVAEGTEPIVHDRLGAAVEVHRQGLHVSLQGSYELPLHISVGDHNFIINEVREAV